MRLLGSFFSFFFLHLKGLCYSRLVDFVLVLPIIVTALFKNLTNAVPSFVFALLINYPFHVVWCYCSRSVSCGDWPFFMTLPP